MKCAWSGWPPEKSGAKSVLDLGCGSGRLLGLLMKDRQFERILGVDASSRDLEIAAERLRLDELSEAQRQRISLIHGALTYRDKRLAGFDAAAMVEVIEHIDRPSNAGSSSGSQARSKRRASGTDSKPTGCASMPS